MKHKGINPIERNIEKIVLGLVTLALLAAISMQFLLQPNQVEVGPNRSVPPGEIYVALSDEASSLQGQMNDRNPSLPQVQQTDLLDRYESALSDAASGRPTMPPLVDAVDVLGGQQVDVGTNVAGGPIMAPSVPAPTQAIAHSQWGTLDPYAVMENEALRALAPPEQPYDVPGVSVEAKFSGADLGRMLATSSESARAIPGAWRRQVEIVRVETERQQLLPDGTWGDATPGTPLPTGFDPFQGASLDTIDLSTLLTAADASRDNRKRVVQSRFAPLIAGPIWAPPTDAIEAAAAMSDLDSLPRLRSELAKAEGQLRDLEEDKQNLSSRPQNQTTTTVRDDPRGGSGPGRGGGTSSTSSRTSGSQTAGRNLDTRIRELNEEIREINEKIRVKEQELDLKRRDEAAALERPLFEQDSLRLWAHDFGVEAGATYRYRVRAVINNPLFKKESQLDPDDAEQQAMAGRPLVEGDWSSWTDPVTVGARTYYFVTSASESAQLGASEPQAVVEVYRMYYGFYRKDLSQLAPGDPIVAGLEAPKNFYTFDTTALDSQGMRRFIESLNRPGSTGNRPPPPPLSGSSASGSQDLPAGVVTLSPEIEVALSSYLLEVASLPLTRSGLGGVQALVQAVFRASDGSLETRRPSSDRSSPELASAKASAEAGETATMRVPEDEGQLSGRFRNPYPPTDDPRGGRMQPILDEGP